MSLVYESTVENDDADIGQCPECGFYCSFRRYEDYEGNAVYQRSAHFCSVCGLHFCKDETCVICNNRFTISTKEEADYYINEVCSVSSLTEALVFLSKYEVSLMSAKAMLEFGDSSSAKAMILDGQIYYGAFLNSSLPKTPLLESLVTSVMQLSMDSALSLYPD